MAINKIKKDICKSCKPCADGCKVVDSCPTDVIRTDDKGWPYIAYPDDCVSCFLCQMDCPCKAVEVGALITIPHLPSY